MGTVARLPTTILHKRYTVALLGRGVVPGPRGSDWRKGHRSRGEETPMTNDDALIEEIDAAYRGLSAAAEDLAGADRELAEHVRRIRLDNAEAILEAKNERTASLSTSTTCSTPPRTAAWRPSGRGPSSTTSTPGARWRGCS
jgi:hypothetical protein